MKCVLRSLVPALAFAFAASSACAQIQSIADIEQHGSGDAATIDQTGNTGNATATIRQDGDGNVGSISETVLYTDLAAHAGTQIDQAGSGNVARIDQLSTDMMGVGVMQQGNGNQVTFTVHSGRSGAGSVQIGDGNVGELFFDTSRAGLSLLQTGNNNYGRVTMHDGGFLSVYATMTGDANAAYIDQSGLFNDVLTSQTGQYNELHVTQQDESHVGGDSITVTQASDFNYASVAQSGSGLTATVTQDTGNGNSASVNQHF